MVRGDDPELTDDEEWRLPYWDYSVPGDRADRTMPVEFSVETREELMYDKSRLLANGDRWEPELAKRLELDAPYR